MKPQSLVNKQFSKFNRDMQILPKTAREKVMNQKLFRRFFLQRFALSKEVYIFLLQPCIRMTVCKLYFLYKHYYDKIIDIRKYFNNTFKIFLAKIKKYLANLVVAKLYVFQISQQHRFEKV
eukprot:TRINITY_DN2686_c0_g1_i3.p11 TRINITY_DN2686_c0_g1~~TRINITY_DN2686_c0_g1_i3.p11  ORF type:complete len:121 (+),score=2.68 TRINITY_DN2686_c0_g1_i3:423-785(+)